ncbi:MAG TPA: hypothetical protein VF450_15050 [Noviherbaspirillum sp.]
MKVTKPMLDAAMRKAVEAGLLPREALRQESYADREVFRLILEAAIDTIEIAYPETSYRSKYPPLRRLARTRQTGAT